MTKSEYWVLEYKGEDVKSYFLDGKVDGPYDTQRKAENAMTEYISRGKTNLIVVEVSSFEYF